ncbi:MAG: hypothetical protein DHS80DRAFT_23148 [Piptocephalis tieghemiana]|nr:MAG: hypothetical protein DHS80DRAFT_23148 [Piptocephalis tieghemiana]
MIPLPAPDALSLSLSQPPLDPTLLLIPGSEETDWNVMGIDDLNPPWTPFLPPNPFPISSSNLTPRENPFPSSSTSHENSPPLSSSIFPVQMQEDYPEPITHDDFPYFVFPIGTISILLLIALCLLGRMLRRRYRERAARATECDVQTYTGPDEESPPFNSNSPPPSRSLVTNILSPYNRTHDHSLSSTHSPRVRPSRPPPLSSRYSYIAKLIEYRRLSSYHSSIPIDWRQPSYPPRSYPRRAPAHPITLPSKRSSVLPMPMPSPSHWNYHSMRHSESTGSLIPNSSRRFSPQATFPSSSRPEFYSTHLSSVLVPYDSPARPETYRVYRRDDGDWWASSVPWHDHHDKASPLGWCIVQQPTRPHPSMSYSCPRS